MNAVLQSLYTKLSADNGAGGVATLATGGIHDSVAPNNTAPPFLIIQKHSPIPVAWTFSLKATDAALYMVKAYAIDDASGGGRKNAGAIVERAEAILNDASLSVSGRTLLYCRKDRDVPDSCEFDGDARVFGVGFLIRIEVQ
jgi:hypothetical protein